jgi:hypothetical protein
MAFSQRNADCLAIKLSMADGERRERDSRAVSQRMVYEPRVALRRIESAVLALVIITATGALGYMVFEGWSFTDALYMTVITLTAVGYREVRELDTSGQLWTMDPPDNWGGHPLLRGRLLGGARGGRNDTRVFGEEKDGGGDRQT